jgi:hypothetical protein
VATENVVRGWNSSVCGAHRGSRRCVSSLQAIGWNPNLLVQAASEADEAVSNLGLPSSQPEQKLYLNGRLSEVSVPYVYKGVCWRTEQSTVSGGPYRVYGPQLEERQTQLFELLVGSGNSEPLIPEIMTRSALAGKISSRLR